MDIKVLLITNVFIAFAIAGLLLKLLIRPGSQFTHSLCSGYGKYSKEMEGKCAVCEINNTTQCPLDISNDKNLKRN